MWYEIDIYATHKRTFKTIKTRKTILEHIHMHHIHHKRTKKKPWYSPYYTSTYAKVMIARNSSHFVVESKHPKFK